MTRHEMREAVFKSIFQIPFYEGNVPEIDIETDYKASEDDMNYIIERVKVIQDKLDEIDSLIEKESRGWKTGRMGKAELAILRLAVYEIKFDPDVPDKVAANEAVELTKQYCDEKASAFVNGVISGVISE